MKICVLVNKQGEIIGTARDTPFQGEVQVGIRPGKGQTVYNLEVPDEFAQLNASEIHERLQTLLNKGRAKESKSKPKPLPSSD